MSKRRKIMSELRLSKNVIAQYSSFQEMAAALSKHNPKEKNNTQNDANWEAHLNKMKEKILGKCVVCGEQLGFISGTNTCACKNPDCKGKKVTRKDGTFFYVPISKTLKPRDARYANDNF